MMNDIAVKLENVSKYYKLYASKKDRIKEVLHPGNKQYHQNFCALNNINLEIKAGETLGIMGMNGSGKSTLLKIISGILQPNSGTVKVNGKISALLELGSAFNPEFTGIDNIYFYGMLLGFKRHEMESKIDDILSFADIGVFIHQPIKTYSNGMKSRLGFSVAVHVDPDILILDEVLAVGDGLFKRKCFAKMEELFSRNKTVLFVSHSTNSVKSMCSRAIILDKGSLYLDGASSYVTSHYHKYILAKKNNGEDYSRYDESLDDDNSISDEIDSNKYKYINEIIKNADMGNIYIPEFVPESTVEMKNYEISLSDAKIETVDNKRVNLLVTDQKYIFKCKIKFNVDAEDVSVGASFKDVRGIKISSTSLKKMNKMIKRAATGDQYEVEWTFQCLLLEGIYFIDILITGEINNNRQVLCRVNDLNVFKVVENEQKKYGGMVTLLQEINVRNI